MAKKEPLPLLAMLVFLILAYGLDAAITKIKVVTGPTFRTLEAIWGHVLIELAFACLVVLLVWLVWISRGNKWVIGGPTFLVGLIAFFISTPFNIYLGDLLGASPVPQRGWFYYFLLSFNSFGFFTKAGALIIILGLVELLRKPR
jgi:hypothetical protein